MNVLITSAGRRTSLLEAFMEATRQLGGLVLAGDVDPLAPALYLADRGVRLIPATDPAYVDQLCSLVEEHDVGMLVPTIDTELEPLARQRDRLEALGCITLVSSPELIKATQDKQETVEIFGSHGFRLPRSWSPEQAKIADLPRRLFVKPRRGSASLNTFAIQRERLMPLLEVVPDPIIQELVEAPEVTVDALLSLEGMPLHYVPRLRIRTLAGESIQGVTIADEGFRPWLVRLLEVISRLGGRGPITVQMFLTRPEPTLSEINARFGGGFPLANAAGGKYPEWLLAMASGRRLEPCFGAYETGLSMTRTLREIFTTEPKWA